MLGVLSAFVAFFCIVLGILYYRGYRATIGLSGLSIYADPGSRRFPDGVEVRICTRVVGFLFGWFKGPLLDIYADRFSMRLRPSSSDSTSSAQSSSRQPFEQLFHFFRSKIPLRVRSYVYILLENIAFRCAAILIRFLRVRVGKVKIWKDNSSNPQDGRWELLVEQFVLTGYSYCFVGCKYNCSVNELLFTVTRPPIDNLSSLQPIQASFKLQRGFDIDLRLGINWLSVFRWQRFVFLDNLSATVSANRIFGHCPNVIYGHINEFKITFFPGRSRSLEAKLPALTHVTPREIRPKALQFWEGSATLKGLSLRLSIPSVNTTEGVNLVNTSALTGERNSWISHDFITPPPQNQTTNGLFLRLEDLQLDAYGNNISDVVAYATLGMHGLSAGSSSVETLTQTFSIERLGSKKNMTKLLEMKPELLLWIDEFSLSLDINCSRQSCTQADIGSQGGMSLIDPVGFITIMKQFKNFVGLYYRRHERSVSQDSLELRSSSSSSLLSLTGEPHSIRVLCDLRNWTFGLPAEDEDTLAVVASLATLGSEVLVSESEIKRMTSSVRVFNMRHFHTFGVTETINCEMMSLDATEKNIDLSNCHCIWDFDAHLAIQNALSTLKSTVSKKADKSKRDSNRSSASKWNFGGENISLAVEFPDGPKMRLDVAKFPSCRLDTPTFVGHHVVATMQDHKLAYAKEFRLGSPLHTLRRTVEKRKIDIEVITFVLFLENDEPFGYLLQDWLLRLKSSISVLRGLGKKEDHGGTSAKKSLLPDIHFKSTDVSIYFEDHDLAAFMSRMVPLMQDETLERAKRDGMMMAYKEQLSMNQRAQIVGTTQRFVERMRAVDSRNWIRRVKEFNALFKPMKIANGFLPNLKRPPGSTFKAATLSFDIVLDDRAREMGSIESIRRLKLLDDYELGNKMHNKTGQYDSSSWNSIGFRGVGLNASDVSIHLRDYPHPFLTIDKMHFDNTTIGQAVQKTVWPNICETTVALGRRQLVNIKKGLAPTKSFVDIDLRVNKLHCNFNPTYLAGIADFGRAVSRFFSGGKNPSPRIPWFDSLRVNMHGRMRLTATEFTGRLSSSTSPYSMNDYFVDIASDNFEMLTSRLKPTKHDPFPICWKLFNWHIRPSSFSDDRKSEIVLNHVRVGMNPVFSVGSGDPQDHYFVPFPSEEEIAEGGPGIGRGTLTLLRSETPVEVKDNGFGTFTDWWTGLHEIPNFDSFADFKTQSMILGLDIFVRHAKPMLDESGQWRGQLSPSSSYLYSDAISTLITVTNAIVQRPIPARMPARKLSQMRKPPSKTGLSTTMRGLELNVDAKNLNAMMYNNLEPGHGLFISVGSFTCLLQKRTDIKILDDGEVQRTPNVIGRRLEIGELYSGIQIPELDITLPNYPDMGKLLTVDKILLSDSDKDEMRYMASPRKSGQSIPTSGFGSKDMDTSPFYTYSNSHPLQRGQPLDKVRYDRRLLVDGVRLIWTPLRRASVFAWPDAFRVKKFDVKGPTGDNPNLVTELRKLAKASCGFDEDQEDVQETASPPHSSSKLELSEDINDVINQYVDDGEMESKELFDNDGESSSLFTNQPDTSSSSAPLRRSKAIVRNKHIRSLIDLIPRGRSSIDQQVAEDTPSAEAKREEEQDGDAESQSSQEALNILYELDETHTVHSNPKFAVYINDCEVVFCAPETSDYVFLRSKAVRIGLIDKLRGKSQQLGSETDQWADREHRIHLEGAEIYARDKTADVSGVRTRGKNDSTFDFNSKDWVENNTEDKAMHLITGTPMSMELIYLISSEEGDEDDDDQAIRPALLFINIPGLNLSTNASEFHALTDVIRKVLMQSMRSSELVKQELSNLRYNLQLENETVTTATLELYMKRLNNLMKQILYGADRAQSYLVERLMLPDEKSFGQTMQRYKAMAKAVATFWRKDRRAMSNSQLFPTMYICYSFDQVSWELRELRKEQNKTVDAPFLFTELKHLICQHTFYVGRGSTTEITFREISAQNMIEGSYFKRILRPAKPQDAKAFNRKPIKSSTGGGAAFSLLLTQSEVVGGIPVYELLSIKVAPMVMAFTKGLWKSISAFIFSTRTKAHETDPTTSESAPESRGLFSNILSKTVGAVQQRFANSSESSGRTDHSKGKAEGSGVGSAVDSDDVSKMEKRGDNNILIRYFYVDQMDLVASYKSNDGDGKSWLKDVFDLRIRTPSFFISNEVGTWKEFSKLLLKTTLKSVVFKSVANLAKTKLIPKFNRGHRDVEGAASSAAATTAVATTSKAGPSNAGGDDQPRGSESEAEMPDVLGDDDVDDTATNPGAGSQAEIDQVLIEIQEQLANGSPDLRQRILRILYGWGRLFSIHNMQFRRPWWLFGAGGATKEEEEARRRKRDRARDLLFRAGVNVSRGAITADLSTAERSEGEGKKWRRFRGFRR